MGRLALIWRFVRRGALLTRGQAVLAIILIALPVAGLAGVTLVLQSRTPTLAESTQFLLGRTQSKLSVVNSPDPTLRQQSPGSTTWDVATDETGAPVHPSDSSKEIDPRTVLPAGTTVLRLADSQATVKTATGQALLPVTLGSSWDPSLTGRFDFVTGRRPVAPNEAMVTSATLDRLKEKVGDTVHLLSPVKRDYVIVGTLADRRSTDAEQELFLPDAAFTGTGDAPALDSYSYYLPQLDLSSAQLHQLNGDGIIGTSRTVIAAHGISGDALEYQSSGTFVLIAMAFAFGSFEIVLLAGSAFFIGARSRQRVLAIVASTGATRGTLVAMVAFSGAAVGLIGGLVGGAAGVGLGSAVMAASRNGSALRYPGYHLEWSSQLGIVLLAGLIGFFAALVPAIAVSRTDVVAALRGATRPLKVRRRRPVIATTVTAVGVALLLVCGGVVAALSGPLSGSSKLPPFVVNHESQIVVAFTWGLTAGAIITQLGLILGSGLLLRLLSRAAPRFGTSAKLASRDLDRNRSRAVPAIAAIMTTSFLAALLGGLMTTQDAGDVIYYNSALRTGQVGVALDADPDDGLNASSATADKVAQVLRSTFDTSSVSVLWGVPDFSYSPSYLGAATTTPQPTVTTPERNLCPPINGHSTQRQMVGPTSKDWRCQDVWANDQYRALIAPTLLVGGVDDLRQILGRAPSAAAVTALQNGGAVSLHRQFVADGTLRIGWYNPETTDLADNKAMEKPLRAATVSAVVDEPMEGASGFGVVLSPQAAAALGLKPQPMTALATLRTPATDAQQDAAQQQLHALNVAGAQVEGAEVETGPHLNFAPGLIWAVLAVGALVMLAAAVVALTLARQDGAREAATFRSLGAPPRIERSLALWRSLVVLGIGAVLGTATAALTVYASVGISTPITFRMPWLGLAAMTIGLALVVGLGAWAFARPLRSGVVRSAIA